MLNDIVLSSVLFVFKSLLTSVFHFPDTVPKSSRNCLHLPLLFLAFPFLTDPWKTWACERAPYTTRLVSPDVRPGPPSLIGIGLIIVRISFFKSLIFMSYFSIASLAVGIYSCFLELLKASFLKSVWNTCPEMPSPSLPLFCEPQDDMAPSCVCHSYRAVKSSFVGGGSASRGTL